MKELNEYFKKTEGMSYKAFCELYNDAKPLKGNLKFTAFPEDILKILLMRSVEMKKIIAVIPQEFLDFLNKEGITGTYISLAIERWGQRTPNSFKRGMRMLIFSELIYVNDVMEPYHIKWLEYWENSRIKVTGYSMLHAFLKEKDILKEFLENISIRKNEEKCVLTNANFHTFSWGRSSQGFEFWNNLEQEFQRWVNEHILITKK